MSDYISREAAIEYLMTNMGWQDEDGYPVDDADEKRKIITDLISGIPAADVREVVRGKWNPAKDGYYGHVMCSVCHKIESHDTNFCPNCGADMREDINEKS